MKQKIIGKGTWLDKVAYTLLQKNAQLKLSSSKLKIESGLGASGFPHIGSFADAARAYGVKLAIENLDRAAEYIAFSDDTDGLRKVPDGLPDWLENYIGFPVSSIPDPFECHRSYGNHMSSMLLEVLDTCGIKYTHISAYDAYRSGLFNEEIKIALDNADRIGHIIQDELEQEKYLEALPYFPICDNCGRIYTTKALEWVPETSSILYLCEGATIGTKWIKGCSYKGETDYRSGKGKLSWKVEFAARWAALNIDFEAYGKDIADSVRVNDRIIKEVYNKAPPLHIRYEMFLDKGGQKISKSKGNVLTPQVWFKYGSRNSLLLLMYKRIIGAREISILDIPKYMDELDELEEIYFGHKKISDEKEKVKLKGLYEYCYLLNPPPYPSIHIPYHLLLNLTELSSGNSIDFILSKLRDYGYKIEVDKENIQKRITYTQNWLRDFKEQKPITVSLTEDEKNVIEEIIILLQSRIVTSEDAQNLIYKVAKQHKIPVKQIFQKFYMLLFNQSHGPRLGPYIVITGQDTIIILLKKALQQVQTEG